MSKLSSEKQSRRGGAPNLVIDWDAYLPYFENAAIPDEQKRELIKTLWEIMVSFVDLGFDLHPTQHTCGKGPSSPTALLSQILRSEQEDVPDLLNDAANDQDLPDERGQAS